MIRIEKTPVFAAILVTAGLGFAVAGDAGARERGINERQHVQQNRVSAGVRSGSIDRHEAQALSRSAQRIEHKEQAYRADGRFTRAERQDIQRDLDHQSHRVHEARNNHGRHGWSGSVHAHGSNSNGWGPHHGFGYPQGQYVDRLQHQQRTQIRQGVHNGQLTSREAHILRNEQREIAALERHYRADGVLSPGERRDLGQRLHEAGWHIYNEAHDAERNRYGYNGWGY